MPERLATACLIATLAFWAYTQTLLPGVDLGDTGGFQAAVTWKQVSARQAYPLYYNLAQPFVNAACGFQAWPGDGCNVARALNLFSAIGAATAVGLLAYVVAAVMRSALAGIVAALLLAFSYTFWSQAIIAEVYALHLALVAACLLALHGYARSPTTLRLALFFGLYAMSFGNHLSMVLLLPPFTAFLILVTPEPRRLLRPAPIALAVSIAGLGALQYWPNFASVAFGNGAPAGWIDKLAHFWFDTTKADWRETMVLGVQGYQMQDRLAMWWFDARQQFGVAGLALAAVGATTLWRTSRPWAVLVISAFAINTIFAFTYNVGDSHVFFLPGHFFVALCAGASMAAVGRDGPSRRDARPLWRARGLVLPALGITLALWRGWSTWPAIDRHDDRRAEGLITRLTLGVSDPEAMLVSQMNWQLENVLLYIGRHQRQDVSWVRLGEVLPHFPFLVEDQQAIARDMVLTSEAAADVVSSYGARFPLVEDDVVAVTSLSAEASRIPAGGTYVLSILTPAREERLDQADLAAAIETLTGGRPPTRIPGAFEVIAGIAGQPPSVYRSADVPFTIDVPFANASVTGAQPRLTIRMDSWLPIDTFRRAGFGHVLRGRQHVQILERGVNLVWFDQAGRASLPFYAASLYAAKPRYRIPHQAAARLARTN